jgi:hypothetical protein
MSQFLAETLLGNMPLVLTNKLFKSLLGLIFECCGIARAVPMEINETKVFLDFHIYAILDFDLLIGHPLKKFQEKPSYGSLDERLGTTASANPIPCPERPKAMQQPNHNPFEEVKFISPFFSPRLPSETEHPLPTSLEHKPCPSSHKPIVLDNDRDTTLTMHDEYFEEENICAMDIPITFTLDSKGKDSTYEHESITLETSFDSGSLLEYLEFMLPSTMCFHENHNHISVLVCKLFKRMVVDVFIYHKHCKS